MQDPSALADERCGACDVRIGDVTRDPVTHVLTNRRLLASLDSDRAAVLASHYGGTPPEMLCPTCSLNTMTVLNGAMPERVRRNE